MGVINFREADLVVRGCPVADGGPSCCHGCGGGWPGTRVTTEKLTAAVRAVRINPDFLGCQPLADRTRIGLAEMGELRVAIADLSFNWTC